jgi:hypothetical protein
MENTSFVGRNAASLFGQLVALAAIEAIRVHAGIPSVQSDSPNILLFAAIFFTTTVISTEVIHLVRQSKARRAGGA